MQNIEIISYAITSGTVEGEVDFKELGKNNLFSILIHLYSNGRCMKSALYSTSNTGSLPSKVKYLIELGLILEDQRRFENNTKYIELTDKGMRIARRIADIEDMMNGLDLESEQSNHGSPEMEESEVRS